MSDILSWLKWAAPGARYARSTADDKAELERLVNSGASPEALRAFWNDIIERAEQDGKRITH